MSFRVLANHAHVLPESIRAEGTVGRLLELMDACGIEQAICFAPFPHQLQGTEIDANIWLAEAIKPNSRLFGFGTIDPTRADTRDQVKRVFDLGFRGIKLHPNAQHFDILSPLIADVYAAAQELDLFIAFHTGVHQSRLAESAVMRFDEIAWNFPKLRFSLEHVGGYHFFNEALAVIFNHVPPPWESARACNVFAGLSSVFTQDRNRFWHLTDDRLKELAAQVGVRQLIFGLDFPYNLEPQTRVAFATLERLFNESDRALILGGNLRRELRIN